MMDSRSYSLMALTGLIVFPPIAAVGPVAGKPSTTAPKKVAAAVPLATAANGMSILSPTDTATYPVTDGSRTIQVPAGMVYIPAGNFTAGEGPNATTVNLPGYCIGRFSVTNAEYKAFLDATKSTDYPQYWVNGTYPAGKGNHPVVYVSLLEAQAYAAWVSQKTGWNVTLPTGNQWEKAARGPKAYLYPWGNTQDTHYSNGVLTSKFSYNAVTAAYYLKNDPNLPVSYNNPKSSHYGTKTTVDQIAGYDQSGNPDYLSVSPNGGVTGWVQHATYTGFIYTDLFTSLNATGGNTTAVGSYEAGKSGYGCYDMAGDVWNWCSSMIVSTHGAERGRSVNEIRGGSWYATARSCQSVSTGEGRSARGAYNTVGFRLVMIPAQTP